jgi:hypothetical protein
MEKGAALNVFFREQNGRLEDTSDRSYGDELYCRERPKADIRTQSTTAPEGAVVNTALELCFLPFFYSN